MAFYWPNAAMTAQRVPDDIRMNGAVMPADIVRRVESVTMARTIGQASTVVIPYANTDRVLNSNDYMAHGVRLTLGIPFVLVQYNKNGNLLTATYEDAVINKLRGVKGPRTAAPGVVTRVGFAAQLCREAGVPFIGQPGTARSTEVLARGTTEDTTEDTWTCITRLAQARAWRCFSDGTSILMGSDAWLTSRAAMPGGPAMVLGEGKGGVTNIDAELDIGKPMSTASVTARRSSWTADPGAWVQLSGMGPADAYQWLVTDIPVTFATDLMTVTLSTAQAETGEPAQQSGTTTASSTAGLTKVVHGTVPESQWDYLIRLGYKGHADRVEALYVTPGDLAAARRA